MYVFVYGTLKEGHGNHRVLRGAEKIASNAEINGYEMYHLGGFPGIVPGTGTVHGEVYKITEDHLPWLDNLEGYSEDANPENCMYLRETVTVTTDDGDYEAFVYIWNDDASWISRRMKIESGRWD